MADHQLTGELVLREAWSKADEAVKIIPAANTQFSIELDAADGDNVQNIPKDIKSKTSITTASGTVVAAFDVKSIKTINLYSNTTTNITTPNVLTLQVSPSDTDNVWISTTLTLTPSNTSGTVVMGTAISIVARRARVITAAGNTNGAYDLYIVGQAI